MYTHTHTHLHCTSISDVAKNEDSAWYQTLTYRQRDVLAFNQHVHRKASEKGRLAGVDLGMSIGRATTTTATDERLVSPTVLPNTCLWTNLSKRSGP